MNKPEYSEVIRSLRDCSQFYPACTDCYIEKKSLRNEYGNMSTGERCYQHLMLDAVELITDLRTQNAELLKNKVGCIADAALAMQKLGEALCEAKSRIQEEIEKVKGE